MLDDATFYAVYGPWQPLTPAGVADLFAGCTARWWIVGGRAARVGAAADRDHEDTDVAIAESDLPLVRAHLVGWHLWEANDGWLRPLLPDGEPDPACEQMWLRRNASAPWVVDLLRQRGDAEWVFKKDSQVRVPWDRALHEVDGVRYLRPELALLHKAHLDRPKDRADLAAAALDAEARSWLVEQLTMLGHHEWARLAQPRPT